jgi:hypothetical protein
MPDVLPLAPCSSLYLHKFSFIDSHFSAFEVIEVIIESWASRSAASRSSAPVR